MRNIIYTIASILLASLTAHAIAPAQVRYHDEAADTTRINDLLIEAAAVDFADSGKAAEWFAMKFLGTPYVAHTLEGDPEMLTVNVDELDCTTFVETVMALAITRQERRQSWRDFIHNLERVRYRGGELAGYPSRLHYNAEWVADNVHRGNITDVTTRFPRCNYVTKTIDFMSANAEKYAALKDSANLAGIKNMEIGFRSHRIPYIKTIDLVRPEVKAAFRTGDILGFTTTLKNLDITHMGMIVMRDGEPYVIHASMNAGKVVLSERPIDVFLKRNRAFTGVRVLRLRD